jgi:hypothetical protein
MLTKAGLGIVIFCLIFITFRLNADDNILKDIMPSKDIQYVIRLTNGDILSGYVIEMMHDADEGDGIKFRTSIGNAIIYQNQIVEIKIAEENYRQGHRVFLLPTAEGIKDNYFIGIFELGFLYAGAGIGDIFSVTMGRSLIPGIYSNQQVSVIDFKASILSMDFESIARRAALAVGGNLSFINNNNRLVHFYGVGSVTLSRTTLSAAIFFKTGSQDYYQIFFANNFIPMTYEDGSAGISLGLDTRISKRHDLHFIAELWNSNVVKPTNTGVLLGFRLCNTNFSTDFGFALFTNPFFVPFASFVWTPF